MIIRKKLSYWMKEKLTKYFSIPFSCSFYLGGHFQMLLENYVERILNISTDVAM